MNHAPRPIIVHETSIWLVVDIVDAVKHFDPYVLTVDALECQCHG